MRLNREQRIAVQKALVEKGYPLKVDGVIGKNSKAAISKFQKSIGLPGGGKPGPKTLAALGVKVAAKAAKRPAKTIRRSNGKKPTDPIWIKRARDAIGTREIKGSKHNPKILQWWTAIRAPFTDDETPWCAGFVGGIFESCNIRSTRKANARSYNNWGMGLDKPAYGCVVTFWRGKKNGWSGHVGFVVGQDIKGNLWVLGGNQNDRVKISRYSREKVLEYRWPTGTGLKPNFDLPVFEGSGGLNDRQA